MKKLVVSVCAVGLLAMPAAGGGDAYYLDQFLPWNDPLLPGAMDTVFGGGGWIDDNYDTVNVGQLFSGDTSFIYMEGSDSSADELENFLAANGAALEAWVSGGGRLLLNAAPNEGDGMSYGFGGVTLNYADFSDEGHAVNPGHAIFNGPHGNPGTDFTGDAFGHATVSGGGLTPVIENEFGSTVLGEFAWGSGNVMVGGMTAPIWNQGDFVDSGEVLRANMIDYIATIPAPGALALLGLGGLAASRRRRR